MSDNATKNDVKEAQIVEMTTGPLPVGTPQGVAPPYSPPQYNQRVGPVQGAPVGPPYNQQHGAVQQAPVYPPYGQQFGAVPAAPVGPPYGYNQQFGAVQAAPVGYNQQFAPVQAAPVGVYVSPHPAPVVTSEVKVELKTPAANVVVVEPPERDCYFYCFDISGDYQWYDLRGKGLCWIFLLLLLWLTAGLAVAVVMLLWMLLACFYGSSNDEL
ncbi:uncharacterized protein [Acropora muricata]|uniref:uncharacterized protein LOC122947129 isoform X2 n=1 Tax=Acropora millepora TaxID=45264 RepID=UPI001CF0FFC9|nr:uncharacterized protein LOC122947129 isoform X2 [Acropora millepora]